MGSNQNVFGLEVKEGGTSDASRVDDRVVVIEAQ